MPGAGRPPSASSPPACPTRPRRSGATAGSTSSTSTAVTLAGPDGAGSGADRGGGDRGPGGRPPPVRRRPRRGRDRPVGRRQGRRGRPRRGPGRRPGRLRRAEHGLRPGPPRSSGWPPAPWSTGPIVVQVHAATARRRHLPPPGRARSAPTPRPPWSRSRPRCPAPGWSPRSPRSRWATPPGPGYLTVQDLDPATWQVATQVSRGRARPPTSWPRAPPSAATTPACAPTAAWSAGAPPATCWPPTSATATRCSTSAPSRTTPPPTPPASCCSRGPPADHSRSVYTGLIRVRPEARGTERLPDQPQPQAVRATPGPSRCPTSRSRTTTCKCTHASAVGPVDEEQRFYLESRGVPTDVAERLIVAGFFDEVLVRFPDQAVADQVARPRSPARLRGARRDPRSVGATTSAAGEARRFDVDGCPVALVRIGDEFLRHRRHLQPRRLLAVGGRGGHRRVHHRVLEARQRLLAARPASPSRCRPPGRSRCTP